MRVEACEEGRVHSEEAEGVRLGTCEVREAHKETVDGARRVGVGVMAFIFRAASSASVGGGRAGLVGVDGTHVDEIRDHCFDGV